MDVHVNMDTCVSNTVSMDFNETAFVLNTVLYVLSTTNYLSMKKVSISSKLCIMPL